MTIEVRVEADSVRRNHPDLRIASLVVKFPRYILAEVNTHRVFSRSFSSSRAIPTKRMIANIRRDPAMPIHWGENRPGMQATVELDGWRYEAARLLWLAGMWIMTTLALIGLRLGMHKQVVNRMVEPWAHVTGIITSTEWDNFFKLRNHPDADPTFRLLASRMYAALEKSTPRILDHGDWHMPFILAEDITERRKVFYDRGLRDRALHSAATLDLLVVSAARCARVSYANFDGKRSTFEEDVALCEKLAGAEPRHASPFEHQATPMEGVDFCLNFRGWAQQRFFIQPDTNPGWPALLLKYPD